MFSVLVALAQLMDTQIGLNAERMPTMSRYNLRKGSDWCLLETPRPSVTGTFFGIYGQAGLGTGFILSNRSWSSFERGGTTKVSILLDGRVREVDASTGYEEAIGGGKTGTLFFQMSNDTLMSLYRRNASKMEFRKGNAFLTELEFNDHYRLAYLEFAACLEGATDPFADEKK